MRLDRPSLAQALPEHVAVAWGGQSQGRATSTHLWRWGSQWNVKALKHQVGKPRQGLLQKCTGSGDSGSFVPKP